MDPTTQHFMPLAMELSGRWGPSAQRLFSLVSERARDLKGLKGGKYASFAGYWRRVIAVGFQRDIARSAIRIKNAALDTRHPSPKEAIDLGALA